MMADIRCPECGSQVVDFTIHGGPVQLRCLQGHEVVLAPMPAETEETNDSKGILARAADALRDMISH